ncbi:hypothetical protein [Actinomadura algeriensis]|uniref:Uncharacterized protein n=1 Tax=Actinomadura algeriensis TaxID=1679523 RepID=A0ABR9K472_9ACTN|nr:hypothetical protein [Actinomadura algeriensis]MBE1537612.1 hypothetical protein [Actinomadura algeriensis]
MFEQPPCPDGHGPDCPERVCVECGAAVLLGSLVGPAPVADPAPDPARGPACAASPSRPSARRTAGAAGGASTRTVA